MCIIWRAFIVDWTQTLGVVLQDEVNAANISIFKDNNHIITVYMKQMRQKKNGNF